MFGENWDDPSSTATLQPQPSYDRDNGSFKKNKGFRAQSSFGNSNYNKGNYSNREKNNTGGGFSHKKSSRFNDHNRCNTTLVKVEDNKIAKIIGRQGSKIRELEEKTGTKIKIGDYCDNNYLRKVIIMGPEKGQKECKELIEELVAVRTPKFTYEPVEENIPIIDWDRINALYDQAEAEKWAKCPPLKKNFYSEDPEIAKMTKEEVETFRTNNNNIVVKNIFGEGEPILNPVITFAQAFQHYPEILSEIQKQGFHAPSPIQCQAWPILLSGRDLIGIAQTGTGKTLAFLLPALIHIDGQEVPRSERAGANVLIIAPTRELALQIEKEVQKYSYKGIKSVCIYGGANRREQMKIVTDGVEIIIATPGRLNDLVEAKVIDVSSITYLVLDEADRMLDLGFEPQIRKVLLDIRPDRQNVMTSATWPSKVQSLAERYMNNPVQVYIGSLDLAAVHSVTQTVLIIEEEEKKDYLLDFIHNLTKEDKVIIFVSKKILADDLSCDLSLNRIVCQCIHGNREQIDREQALDDLKTGCVRILIATDVASRGLDISDITKVLNYDFPRNIEEYVHRVGRTGRAGKKGESITFFTKKDWAFAGELITIMEEADQPVPGELYKMKDRFAQMQERKKQEIRAGGGLRTGRRERQSSNFFMD